MVERFPAAEAQGPVSARVATVARRLRGLAGNGLRELGLHPGQEMVLMLLWEEEPRLQRDLTASLEIEPPTMTKTLQRLEAAGFVTRGRSAVDSRQIDVHLTDAGRALEGPVLDWWMTLETATTGRFTPSEKQEFARLLDKFSAGISAAAANDEGS